MDDTNNQSGDIAGVIAPPDPVGAWAHADLASKLTRGSTIREAESRRDTYGELLTASELEEAKALASSLCELWCDPP